MPIYKNVDSAPFQIGEKVKVLNNPNKDETFDEQFSFESGVIIYYEYECGCGQSFPKDPMIGVKFESGSVEEFWKEEIEAIG
jgi:hypothetical protein